MIERNLQKRREAANDRSVRLEIGQRIEIVLRVVKWAKFSIEELVQSGNVDPKAEQEKANHEQPIDSRRP